MNLLETIKDIDAKMESRKQEIEVLSQALLYIMDDLVDNKLTLCLEPAYVEHAYKVLKDRGLVDSYRSQDYEATQQGMCDTSVRLKQICRTITGVE